MFDHLYQPFSVDMVYTVGMIYTVDTVYTVHTIHTALHCLNISMYAYICCQGSLEPYWSGPVQNEWTEWSGYLFGTGQGTKTDEFS